MNSHTYITVKAYFTEWMQAEEHVRICNWWKSALYKNETVMRGMKK